MKIPRGPIWETIQIGSVSIRGKPYRDQDDFNIVCPRCATANPLVSSESLDGCGNCQQEYVYSFSNFEPLPLVEFKFEDDLTDQEAYGLIDTAGFQKEKTDSIQTGGSYERMDFSTSGLDNNMTFEKLLVQSDGEIILSREMLRNLSHSEVLVRKYEKPKRKGSSSYSCMVSLIPRGSKRHKLRLGLKPYKRWQFFKNIIPSYNLKIDPDSYHFYQAEDWEMLLLQTGQSPFSRRKVKETEEDAEDEDFGL